MTTTPLIMALETGHRHLYITAKTLYNAHMAMLKTAPVIHTYTPLTFQIPMKADHADDILIAMQELNPALRIERNAQGEFVVMSPASSDTGGRNFDLVITFGNWAKKDGRGKGFDSSAGFTLPNGAVRSPDISWILFERWNTLTEEEQGRFAPICPDFVLELRSRTDQLSMIQAKMNEYMENGARLGWLIDPFGRQVHVYRPEHAPQILEEPAEVSGEPLLTGFTLKMAEFWA